MARGSVDRMDPHEACALLREHDVAATEVVACTNLASGRGIKKAQKRLDRSIKQIFAALVGRKPTEEELKQAQV